LWDIERPAAASYKSCMSEANKAIARAVFDVWQTGQLDRLDDLVAADVVHHDPYDPNGANGLAGMKATIATNREAFAGLAIEVADQIAEGDRVATRWTCTMQHAESGTRVSIAGITIDRFEGGRIVEAWRSMDALGLVRALGG
jgi:predicted ester cyclase